MRGHTGNRKHILMVTLLRLQWVQDKSGIAHTLFCLPVCPAGEAAEVLVEEWPDHEQELRQSERETKENTTTLRI